MTCEEIIARIRRHEPSRLPIGGSRRSAVLVPLRPGTEDPEQLDVVLTRRSADLRHHAGQVSFPGGGMDSADEGPEATALREAREELAIPPNRVEVLGHLDDMLTITGFHVVQVAGLLTPDVTFRPDPTEVARVFCVPMNVLLDPETWELREHEWRGSNFRIWHVPYDGEDIWGATAFMLRGLIEMLWAEGRVD